MENGQAGSGRDENWPIALLVLLLVRQVRCSRARHLRSVVQSHRMVCTCSLRAVEGRHVCPEWDALLLYAPHPHHPTPRSPPRAASSALTHLFPPPLQLPCTTARNDHLRADPHLHQCDLRPRRLLHLRPGVGWPDQGSHKGNSLPHDGEEILDDSTFLCAFCPA